MPSAYQHRCLLTSLGLVSSSVAEHWRYERDEGDQDHSRIARLEQKRRTVSFGCPYEDEYEYMR